MGKLRPGDHTLRLLEVESISAEGAWLLVAPRKGRKQPARIFVRNPYRS